MVTAVKKQRQTLAEGVTVEVLAALTELGVYNVSDMEQISFHVLNADVTYDQFVISGRFINEGTWEVLFNTAADFTTPAGLLIGTSGDLTTIANTATGWFIMDTASLFEIKVEAASSGGASTSTVNAGGS